MDSLKHFIRFKSSVTSFTLPERFTFPFNYEPHPLAKLAAEELQEYIATQNNWNHNFGFESDQEGKVMGKMFGVLVVQNTNKEIGYLAAFSGKIGDDNLHALFVPPVFDRLKENGFYKTQEAFVNQINRKIEALESDSNYIYWTSKLTQELTDSATELEHTRNQIKLEKAARKLKRAQAENKNTPEEFKSLQVRFNKESQDQQRYYKRLTKQWKVQLETTQQHVDTLQQEIDNLKQERKARSAMLQQQLFEQYQFLNQAGEKKHLLDIFKNTLLNTPPAGAGECAAPKLLQYAFKHHLKPIALAEFWWGESPKMEIRKHLHYYPACKGKCEPILSHMLSGMLIDENPLNHQIPEKVIETIFEDEHLLVINKPVNLLSIPGKNKKDSVAFRMKQKYPEATGPLVVHRLDMSTSGLMLIAKTQQIHKVLQSQFIKHTIQKRYVALLDGNIQENEGTIDLPLRVDLNNRPNQLVCFEHGKSARTNWKVIARNNNITRIHFFPITGRTHQLRVHAAHPLGLNTPIIGDDLYGTKSDRLHLHAEYLKFIHPISNTELTFEVAANF